MIPNILEHDEDCEGSVSLSSTIKALPLGRRTAEKIALRQCCHETQSCWIHILGLKKNRGKMPGLHGFRTAARLQWKMDKPPLKSMLWTWVMGKPSKCYWSGLYEDQRLFG